MCQNLEVVKEKHFAFALLFMQPNNVFNFFSLGESVAKFQCLLKVVCRSVKLFQFHLYPFKDRQYKFMRLMHLCSWRNLVMRKSSFASKEGVRTG